MRSEDKNIFTMGILLSMAALFSLYYYFTDFKQADTVLIKDFPRTIGAWVSEDIPLSKQQLVLLGTDNTFVRKYKDPDGKAVYLYIVYSQNNRKIYHPPENCYTGGGGVSILERTLDAIPVSYKNLIIHANRLELQARQLHQITFYWFKAGDSFTSSYWKEQTLVAINSLWGKRQGSALIRISADFTGNNKEAAIREVKEFTGLITPQLMKYLP